MRRVSQSICLGPQVYLEEVKKEKEAYDALIAEVCWSLLVSVRVCMCDRVEAG